ncbi:MAG: BamA/TamA family outer membrane protein [Myxococcaceae bacterium]|nr:BamA/TamA family outer membrane protein [Myxococcaceae bacterium]MBH2006873.1 BamA/TamA family outer membrane protein [Myxococcaceae bacterium]
MKYFFYCTLFFCWAVSGKQTLRIEGAKSIQSHYLDRLIQKKLTSRTQGNGRLFEQIQSEIVNHYRKLGFIFAKVDLSRVSGTQLLCRIREGKQILVRNIEVQGSTYFSAKRIRDRVRAFVLENASGYDIAVVDRAQIDQLLNPTLANQKQPSPVFFEYGFMPFDKSLFLKAKAELEELYIQSGFLDVQIYGPKESEIENDHWIDLQFRIDEGVQTRIRAIEYRGASVHLKDSAIRVGDPLSSEKVEQLRVQLIEHFWNEGYPDATIEQKIEDSKLIFKIQTGERVQIEEIRIQGNQVTQRPLIEYYLKMKPGDWFSWERWMESRSSLLQLDLFSEVELSLEGRTLMVTLKERERNSLELGVGASLVDGPRVSGLWQYRNLLGKGLGFRIRGQLNYPAAFYLLPVFYPLPVQEALKSQTSNYLAGKANMGLTYPQVLGVPFDLSASWDAGYLRDLKPAYILNSASSNGSLHSQVLKNLRLTGQMEIEYSNFTCSACALGESNQNIRADEGVVLQATPRWIGFWDGRDSALLPRKGYSIQLEADYGFGLKDATVGISYFKTLLAGSTYVPIVSSWTWVSHLRGGGIWNLNQGNYVPIFKRFYLGGTSSVRGFAENQIFPADASNTSGVSLGANYFALWRNELQFPIQGDWRGGLFMDAGELLKDIRHFSLQSLSVGTGLGVRYETPIGPLSLDLGVRVLDAHPINYSDVWSLLQLHFSIGDTL